MRLTIFKRLAFGHMIILFLVIFMGGYITGKLNRLHQITYKTAAIDGERISTLEHLLSSVFSLVMFEKKYYKMSQLYLVQDNYFFIKTNFYIF